MSANNKHGALSQMSVETLQRVPCPLVGEYVRCTTNVHSFTRNASLLLTISMRMWRAVLSLPSTVGNYYTGL